MPRDLRTIARGKPCQVRIAGVCNGNPDTTVLAHVRMAGVTGVGQKAPDVLAAWCCSACHDAVDGRTKSPYAKTLLELWFLEGVIRTQYELIKDEYLLAVVA